MTQVNLADNIFKTAFVFTVIVMVGIFSRNIERKPPSVIVGSITQAAREIVHRQIDYNQIKQLISQNKLSDKEAMFYHPVK